MTSKRKYTVAPLSDEDENKDANIGGVATFKKYKAQCEKNNTVVTTASSSSQLIGLKNDEQSSSTMDSRLNSRSVDGENSNPTKQPSTSSLPAATNKVGKNFRETFAYLKKSDLFVLPPIPQPKEKPTPKNSNSIIVNPRQRGNPILKHIRNIPWEYGEIVPDYEIGQTSCALFLSMRYHSLNPEYVHDRLKKLGSMYDLRILLVQVDVVNSKPSLKQLGRIAMYSNCTLILAWSAEEAGRYLETYKSYEHKPPDILQQRIESDHLSKMQDLLTTIKSVNKTDVITLISTFGSLRNIVNATKQEIGDCVGIGPQKASRLHSAFNEPFKRANSLAIEDSQKKPQNKSKSSTDDLPAHCQLKRPVDEKLRKQGYEIQGKSNLESLNKKKTELLDVQKNPSEEQNLSLTSDEQNNETVNGITERISKTQAIQNFMKNKTAMPLIAKTKSSAAEKETFEEKPMVALLDQPKNRMITAKTGKQTLLIAKNEKPLTNTSTNKVRDQQQLTEEEFNDLVASDDDE